MTKEQTEEPDWPHSIGERIAYLRQKRRLTQVDVADRASITAPYLSEIENDKRNPSFSTVAAIADALDVSLDYIRTGEHHSAS